jgi:hypothetical protein
MLIFTRNHINIPPSYLLLLKLMVLEQYQRDGRLLVIIKHLLPRGGRERIS